MEIKFLRQDIHYSEFHVDKKVYWLHGGGGSWPLAEITPKWSEICEEFGKDFQINGFNYSRLFNYILMWSPPIIKSPGFGVILFYIGLLDKHITKDVQLYVKDIFPNTFIECAKLVCAKKKLKLTVIEEEYKISTKKKIFNQPLILASAIYLRLLTRYILGRYRRLKGVIPPHGAKTIALGNLRFSSKDETQNSVFGPLIKKEDIKLIRYERLSQMNNLNRFIKEFVNQKIAYIGDYYTLPHLINCLKDHKKLKLIWEKIRNTNETRNLFVYKGYCFYDVILPRLDFMFKSLSLISTDTRHIAKKISLLEDYKLLLLDHEENLLGKAFMLNDPTKKTLALSFELIYPGCSHGYHKSSRAQDKKSKFYRPTPNVKCVWGNYAKKTLINSCNYPKEIIKITGDPRFDFLFNEIYDNKKLAKKYGLSKKPKVMFASQNRSNLYHLLLEIASENPHFEFIFKPHPKENKQSVEDFFKNKLSNLVIVEPTAKLYEVISVSDYITSFGSSVAFEAMLMGKPVIILNFEKRIEQGLPLSRGGIEVTSAKQFKETLSKLKDKKYAKEASTKAKEFVKQLYTKNDGKATENVIKEMKKLLKTYKHK